MNRVSFLSVIIGVSILSTGTALGGDEADYYAMIEAEAAHMAAVGSVPSSGDNDSTGNIKEGLAELQAASPSAYSVYRTLQPRYKAEVRNALRDGKDVYEVREMILSRNQ